jgi:hypothetical protein
MNKILKEQKFQMTGCVAQECKVEAGQILGVGKIVSGSVGIVGKTYYLTLLLIDVRTGKVELSAEDECRCEIDELLGSTKRLARKLLGEQVVQPPARAEQTARAKTEADAKARVDEIEKLKAEQIEKAKAESEARVKVEQAAKVKAEAEARAKAEEEKRIKAEQIAKARAEADLKARLEAEARLKTEQTALAMVKAEAEAKAKAEAEAKARAEEAERIKSEQIAKARAEEIERLKAEISRARAEAEARAKAAEAEKVRSEQIAKDKENESQIKIASVDKLLVSAKADASDSRFEKLSTGIVRDTKIGLEWYAGPDKNTVWDDAKGWVAGLRVDGGGWRMPTRAELRSLYIKGAGKRNMTPLLETTGWLVWSSETAGPGGVWSLDFGDSRDLFSGRDNSINKRSFAVRSKNESLISKNDVDGTNITVIASDGRFEKLSNGVVRDTQSSLDWFAGPDRDTGWDDVISWIGNLKVDGGGWRMPTFDELKGLYQKGYGSRNITPLLETSGWWIWSDIGRGGGGWKVALDLDRGTELLDSQGNRSHKRGFAVRPKR